MLTRVAEETSNLSRADLVVTARAHRPSPGRSRGSVDPAALPTGRDRVRGAQDADGWHRRITSATDRFNPEYAWARVRSGAYQRS